MDPTGTAGALSEIREAAGTAGTKAVEIQDSPSSTTPSGTSPTTSNGGSMINDLIDDEAPVLEQNQSVPQRPVLDAPTPGTSPSAGSSTMS